MKSIEPSDLAKLQASDSIDLIDVRTPAEFREVHAVGAVNVPLDSLNPTQLMSNRNGRSDQPLYVICKSGGRSSRAIQKLVNHGLEEVVNVEGGTFAWAAAGLPVVRGKKTIALERQVQITAGFLAFLGAVLGYFVHPALIGLSAFIGAGLMFAGITNTCAMGMLLAKMPWNQGDASDGQACSV